MPQFLDAGAVRAWCGLALRALGRDREAIDAINVYPVADGDTGTNLYLTVESAAQAVEEAFAGATAAAARTRTDIGTGAGGDAAHTTPDDASVRGEGAGGDSLSLGEAVRAMAHGALLGARGNSGTILAQLLRGMAQVLTGDRNGAKGAPADERGADGLALARALRGAAEAGYRAVAHPVEGTVLTVATAAARAADRLGGERDCGEVARAAYEGAREALARTPGQLAVLGRAGVVDAGGRGLVAVLAALVEALTGRRPLSAETSGAKAGPGGDVRGPGAPTSALLPDESSAAFPAEPSALLPEECGEAAPDGTGPAFEVIYLLEAADEAVDRLRARLDGLGDSLVVVGGDGLWNVHVHVDDAGAAVEAGVEAGRPYRIRITHFAAGDAHMRAGRPPRARVPRAVVAVVPGEGLAGLYAEAGATTVPQRPGRRLASTELVQAIHRAHADEVVLLPNDAELRPTAAAAAERARSEGLRIALIPTRSPVQGLSALAVHEPERRFDEDVVQMTSAAGATRYGELSIAERQSWTSAGICQAGDVLGLIDGDVAVIGAEVTGMAITVLDRMLSAGGELVTLILGESVPEALAEILEQHVREVHLAVDTVVYRGGRESALLLIGVE
ncbi:DAK2 domain-containing protein [Streptomyces sp. NA04227]|uniref:DAK2 domain-containing protein n=1 Tax=Streptomyces sp. NA04227 TaxID=2742136 RepID=UPI0020CA6F0C|nr:DAK2 domain-containing protein [Streptomyces sp. NA04227]